MSAQIRRFQGGRGGLTVVVIVIVTAQIHCGWNWAGQFPFYIKLLIYMRFVAPVPSLVPELHFIWPNG